MPKSADGQTRTTLFFVLTLGITNALQLPGVLAKYHVIDAPLEPLMALAGLGAFTPLAVALVVLRAEGTSAIRSLLKRLLIWRVGFRWYVLALFGFMGIYVAGVATYRVFAGGSVPWLFLPENPQHIVLMGLMPLVEEPGWRGFALPRLQRRFGPLSAGLRVGALWAAWHTMMFLAVSTSPVLLALSYANIFVANILFSWVYNRTRGSLLIAIVAHVGVHLNNPYHAAPGDWTPVVVYTCAIAMVATATLIFDRDAWASSKLTESDSRTDA